MPDRGRPYNENLYQDLTVLQNRSFFHSLSLADVYEGVPLGFISPQAAAYMVLQHGERTRADHSYNPAPLSEIPLCADPEEVQ